MVTEPCDPRVFFAGERTLLAWFRTGLTIMALGFYGTRLCYFTLWFVYQTDCARVSCTSF
ncbi:MAG: putative membrane protein [Methylophilaceae bacterium]|jgi:putative membrane protein